MEGCVKDFIFQFILKPNYVIQFYLLILEKAYNTCQLATNSYFQEIHVAHHLSIRSF